MTEKNIFVYKLIYVKTAPPPPLPEKVPPLFQQPPSKHGDPVSVKPPPFENLVGGSTTPLPAKRRGFECRFDTSLFLYALKKENYEDFVLKLH